MKTIFVFTFMLLILKFNIVYCIDITIAGGQAQSHQKNVTSYKNTIAFSVGADYYNTKHTFMRSNLTYQQYKYESEQMYDSKYLVLNTLICFPFEYNERFLPYAGFGIQSSILLTKEPQNSNNDISLHSVNIGAYTQIGGYVKSKYFYLGFILDACYYINGVGKIGNEVLPGVCTAQYISIIIPIRHEK
jgi:hypothetical protein